jgi:hypothetical protein
VSEPHPTVPTWTPAPPPQRRRRLVPGIVAIVIAAALLFGGIGLYAARQVTAGGDGASSPEAAAGGLLAALDQGNLARAAGYLDGEERQLVSLYGPRLVEQFAARATGTELQRDGLRLSARDVRFRRVDAGGSADVALLELTGGTVGGRDGRGAKLELPVEELNRRLAKDSDGAVTAVRVVTVRRGDRWRVSLRATLAEHARLAAKGGQPDYGELAADAAAGQGAASPEAAVRELATAIQAGQAQAIERLSPGERQVVRAYRSAQPAGDQGLPMLGGPSFRLEGLTTRTEPIADGVAKVHLTGGRVTVNGESRRLDRSRPDQPAPYLVTIERDGTWYPSLVFTAVDWLLTEKKRERP